MNCRDIETILNDLKVNSRGSIRNKNRVIDKIHIAHISKMSSELMDIRVQIAMHLKHDPLTAENLDRYIYNKQNNL